MNNNKTLLAFSSLARTATENSGDLIGYQKGGGHFIINVTAIALTPSVVFKIQGKDEISGEYYDILTSAAITGVGTTVLKIIPNITAAANVSVSDNIPFNFRVRAEHLDADSITYSVGINLV